MSRSVDSKKKMEIFDDVDEDDDEEMSPSQKTSPSSPTFRRTAMEVIRKQEHAHFRMEEGLKKLLQLHTANEVMRHDPLCHLLLTHYLLVILLLDSPSSFPLLLLVIISFSLPHSHLFPSFYCIFSVVQHQWSIGFENLAESQCKYRSNYAVHGKWQQRKDYYPRNC